MVWPTLNWTEWGRKAVRVLTTRVALVIALVLVFLFVSNRMNAGYAAEVALREERARIAEEKRRAAEGELVAVTADRDTLKAEVARMAPELKAALALAKERGDRVIALMRATTGPLSTGAPDPLKTCLFTVGDTGEIRLEQAILESKAGNHVFVGTTSAWRVTPDGPALFLFGGDLRSAVKLSMGDLPPAAVIPTQPGAQPWTPAVIWEEPKPAPRRGGWGAGPAVALTRDGFSYGLTLAFPEVHFGWDFGLTATGVTGVGGTVGSASLVVRP